MTCTPCSYASLADLSPTLAKWPLTVMTDGAEGCLLLARGRFSLVLCGVDETVDMFKPPSRRRKLSNAKSLCYARDVSECQCRCPLTGRHAVWLISFEKDVVTWTSKATDESGFSVVRLKGVQDGLQGESYDAST